MIPFSGLSIIIHFIIILVRKVYEKLNFRLSFNFLKNEKTSYLIVFLVLGIVMANAFFLIKASLRNSPNIQLTESALSPEKAIADYSKESDKSLVSNETPIENDCPKLFSPKEGSESILSIVDFLKLNDIDSSFKNRALIAANFGINNYVSSAEQNIKLLSILKTGPCLR